MEYIVKTFDELTTMEFYRLAKERVAVFVVEQACPYQEIDEIDPQAIHTYLQADDGEILAYTRIYQEGSAVHFGRVLVHENHRKEGLGKKIVEKTLQVITERFPNQPVVIGAQAYLTDFYGSFGFQAISDVYLEDDIPHIDMEK
ncbi:MULTISPECIES: GNAT family N-acetyltransferase [Enterococcus]|uniref:GNAT family N-acetyltransferase n=1 Tax=Enterococcus TaxID=1350 RepID=UPI0010FA5C85|nr:MULTISPECIES: GNAT family N-acetyltransferase [Enterococcus]KAF1302605.1 acetyltransferase [Enterococcus sp. JM9B]